jgi:hypothetical protein
MRNCTHRALIFALFMYYSNTAAHAAIALQIVPLSQQARVGTPVTVAIMISGLGDFTAPSLGTFDLNINFDPAILAVSSVNFGDPILKDQLNVLGVGSITSTKLGTGFVNLFELSLDTPADLNALQHGAFSVAIVTFTPLAAGISPVSFAVNTLGDASGEPLTAELAGGSIDVGCTLSVNASATAGTLTLEFEVATLEPATWNAWLTAQADIARLFSIRLPELDPPISVPLSLPFFPALGTIGVLTTLTTPEQGIICADFTTVNTGRPVAAAHSRSQALKELVEPRGVELYNQLQRQHLR